MTRRQERNLSIGFFSLIFLYLLIRAAWNETLHDEVATYMFFIYQGDYHGPDMVWDANNHLLNSFIGHLMYPLVKDNFFWLRLPNVLSFTLYAWAAFQFSQLLRFSPARIITFLATISVPFVLEYFAYTRGYGLSFGFFLPGIWFLYRFISEQKYGFLLSSFTLFVLAVSANLTFINSALLLVGFLAVWYVWEGRKTLKNQWVLILFVTAFLAGLYPFVSFSFELKDAGALYYGGKNGLWDNTGESISQYFFFLTGWVGFFVTFTFLLHLLYFLYLALKQRSKDFLKSPYVLFSLFFFGNILGMIALRYFMDINYPEDRTAMYLCPLFILMGGYGLDRYSPKWTSYLLLFFPLSLLFNLSIHSSIFSPQDRMTNAFYQKVKRQMKPEYSLMVYGIMNWNWPMHESHEQVKSSVYNCYNPNATLTDIILTKSTVLNNPMIPILYDTIAVDKKATYLAFKRKGIIKKELFYESEEVSFDTNDEYGLILEKDSLPKVKGKPIQITVSGHLKTFALKNKLQLVVQTVDENEQMVDYWYYPFEAVYQGQLIDDNFLHHFVIENLDANEQKVKVYLWSRNGHRFQVEKGKCYLYHIKQ
jgi:hypothetical protein